MELDRRRYRVDYVALQTLELSMLDGTIRRLTAGDVLDEDETAAVDPVAGRMLRRFEIAAIPIPGKES